MLLREYVAMAHRRWWIVMACMIVLPATWVAMDSRGGTEFQASAAVLVGPSSDVDGSAIDAVVQSRRLVESYADLVLRQPVVEAAIANSSTPITAASLSANTDVVVVEDTSIIEIIVRSSTSDQAISQVNLLTEAFVQIALELTGSSVVSLSVIESAVTSQRLSVAYVRDIGLGIFFGLIAGLIAAFALDEVDSRIRSRRQLGEIGQGVPILGTLPKVGSRIPPRPVQPDDGAIYEAFQILGSSAARQLSELDASVVLVTSPHAADGKTSVALNLAAGLSESDRRVVVVDGDLRRPKLLSMIEYRLEFTPIETSLTTVIKTSFPNLFCAELREGITLKQVQDVVVLLRGWADLIVIDSPPLLPLVDVDVLAEVADASILVVASGATEEQAVLDSLDRLKMCSIPVIGLVLNKMRINDSGYDAYR